MRLYPIMPSLRVTIAKIADIIYNNYVDVSVFFMESNAHMNGISGMLVETTMIKNPFATVLSHLSHVYIAKYLYLIYNAL